MFKKLLIIGALLSVFFCGNAFADNVTCESDETLINGVCEPVCNGTTTNFEYNGTCIKNKFQVTTVSMAAGETFKFQINASGQFYIDWDDPNSAQPVTYSSYGTTFSHTFTDAGVHVIKFGGPGATGYYKSSASSYPAILFGSSSDMAFSTKYSSKIASVSGSLGSLFPTLNDGSNDLSKQPRFYETFYGATNLTSIGPGLFDGVSGAADYMFSRTFSGCSSLTSLPDGLFDGVSGAASSMFNSTFYDCSGLTSLPDGLFDGVSDAADYMFSYTFYNCSGLTSLPDGLFDSVSGAASYMFNNTFYNCRGLTSLPDGLFDGVSGAADYMFNSTFYNCSGLTSLPDGLFDGVSGAADYMFYKTFYSSGLTSLPDGLFDGVSGIASSMFSYTFCNCGNLQTIPADLFSHISGTPALGMFSGTFSSCSKLKYFDYGNGTTVNYIPPTFFEHLDSTNYSSGPLRYMFYATGIATQCPGGMYQYLTGFEADFNPEVSCTPCPNNLSSYPGATSADQCFACEQDHFDYNGACINTKFKVTTVSMAAGETFKFQINAYGKFYIDWDDPNSAQPVTYQSTSYGTTFSHTFTDAGVHVIKFGGPGATGYYSSSASSYPAILFGSSSDMSFSTAYSSKIASVSGSLGSLFPTLNDGSNDLSKQPRFYGTFYGATNLTSIGPGLFDGVFGAADYMFSRTFSDCSSLTSLPDGLFDGVSGAASSMFSSTFSGCSSLTSLPDGLFDGVSGAASSMFSYTFYNCRGLTSLPDGLFDGISGAADYMFNDTFYNCSNLQTIPADLFSHISGTPASGMFSGTFSSCSKLKYFDYGNGTTVNYIPPTFFEHLDSTNYSSGPLRYMFDYTRIATQCPANTYQYLTGFEADFNYRVSCMICPNGTISPAGSTNVSQCVLPSIDLHWDTTIDNNVIDTTCNIGENIVLPAQPTKPGYTFTGWLLQSNP